MSKNALALDTLPWSRLRFIWMFGQKIDLLFFFLPVFLAPLIFILSQSNVIPKSALWGLIILFWARRFSCWYNLAQLY